MEINVLRQSNHAYSLTAIFKPLECATESVRAAATHYVGMTPVFGDFGVFHSPETLTKHAQNKKLIA